MEEFFNNNRQLFDVEPPQGHRLRMEERMRVAAKRRKSRTLRLWGAIGSAAVAAVILVAVWVIPINEAQNADEQRLNAAMAELDELEQYYQQRRQSIKMELEELLSTKNATLRDNVMTQIALMDLQSQNEPVPKELLTKDVDRYFALTINKYEIENQSIENIINILRNCLD